MYRASHTARAAVRAAHPAPATARLLSLTAPRRQIPDPTKPTTDSTEPKPSSPLVPIAAGLAVAGGLYYYFYAYPPASAPRPEQKAREASDDAKRKAEQALGSVQGRYDQVRDEGKEKLDQARARGRASGAVDQARRKVEEEAEWAKVKASEYKGEAERKLDEAKQTSWSWFGWGKQKAEEKTDAVRLQAEHLKRRAGETVDDYRNRIVALVRRKADESEDEFRRRVEEVKRRVGREDESSADLVNLLGQPEESLANKAAEQARSGR